MNYHYHVAEKAGPHYDIAIAGLESGCKKWKMLIPLGEFAGRYTFVGTKIGMLVMKGKIL